MVADSVTFYDVGPDAYGRVRDRLVIGMAGVEPEGEPDVIELRGVRGKLSYDEQARAVTATFHHVPPIVSRGYVLGWLFDAFRAASD